MDADFFVDRSPDDPAWGHGTAPATGGVRLHYVRQGQGIPILLLHGWPGFWYDWRRVIPALAREADAIAPDLRGFGASDKPDLAPREGYTPDVHAADLLALLDHLQLPSAVVVGYDVGSRVAQVLARRAPERVRALVLFAPSYPGFGARRFEPAAQAEFWYQHFHNIPQADRLIGHDRETVRLYLEYFYDHWVGRKDSVRPRELEHIVDVYARPGAVRASIAWYRARAGAAFAPPTPQPPEPPIPHPTTVLWGELDPIFPPSWADRLGEYFPRHTLRVLPGVGHFVPFEAPEAVLEAIRAACSGAPAPSA